MVDIWAYHVNNTQGANNNMDHDDAPDSHTIHELSDDDEGDGSDDHDRSRALELRRQYCAYPWATPIGGEPMQITVPIKFWKHKKITKP